MRLMWMSNLGPSLHLLDTLIMSKNALMQLPHSSLGPSLFSQCRTGYGHQSEPSNACLGLLSLPLMGFTAYWREVYNWSLVVISPWD